jgi:hypothetical protein
MSSRQRGACSARFHHQTWPHLDGPQPQHAITSEARAVCQQCGGHFDTTTVIGRQDTAETMPEPGPQTAAEAAMLRATLGRIVQLMLEVIAGRRPADELATVG